MSLVTRLLDPIRSSVLLVLVAGAVAAGCLGGPEAEPPATAGASGGGGGAGGSGATSAPSSASGPCAVLTTDEIKAVIKQDVVDTRSLNDKACQWSTYGTGFVVVERRSGADGAKAYGDFKGAAVAGVGDEAKFDKTVLWVKAGDRYTKVQVTGQLPADAKAWATELAKIVIARP